MGWGHIVGNKVPRDDPSWWITPPRTVDLSRFWDNVAWFSALDGWVERSDIAYETGEWGSLDGEEGER